MPRYLPALLVRVAAIAAIAALAATAMPTAAASGSDGAAGRDVRSVPRERLAAAADRDSRIAAALLALPSAPDARVDAATTAYAQGLLRGFADDPLALYVASLFCHLQADCSDRSAYERLTAQAPGNAVHWLLLPGAAAPDAATLQHAAAAQSAQPHLGELAAVLGRALTAADGAQLRADAIDAITLPRFAATMNACKMPAHKTVCSALGRRLFDDAQGTILTRMLGSVLLRRLQPGSAEAAAAFEFRRHYVWLGEHEQQLTQTLAQRVAVQADLGDGEWQAWLRAADRAGVARTPPADWKPANPQQLLLAEERRATGG